MKLTVDKSITKENPYKICFVCLGNICRSPTAEGVFSHLVDERGLRPYFEIDSSGTSAYHIGESANSKSQQIAQQHGVTLDSKARQFKTSDFSYFDLIVAMDEENLRNIKQLDVQDEYSYKIEKLRTFDPQPGDGNVPDPYYGGMQGFENVFQIVKRSCKNILDQLKEHID
ncbi:MAG: low molecular weight protein-tyrosine-phosphatase [Balneolaceae bacterium]|nr:low molecular weight protein-tyrosine-phosphatase [Balneolaceae bacterium]